MKKLKFILFSLYIFIIITLFTFIIFIYSEVKTYNQNIERNYVRNFIIQTDKKIIENVYNYIKYNYFNFKPFHIIIKKSNNISDIENKDGLITKNIEVDNNIYEFSYSIEDYLNYIKLFTGKDIIIYYNNKTYPVSINLNNLNNKLSINYENIDFYILNTNNFNERYSHFFMTILVLIFIVLYIIIHRIYYYSKLDILNIIEFINKRDDNIKLNTQEGNILKENITKIIDKNKKLESISEDLKNEFNKNIERYNNIINDFIIDISNKLQNISNYIYLPNKNKEEIINKNINELSNIIDKYIILLDFKQKLENDIENYDFFNLDELLNEIIYYLSQNLYNITIKKQNNLINNIIFGNKKLIYLLLYDILVLILSNKSHGNIILKYYVIDGELEIKIIDENNIYNEYLILLKNKSNHLNIDLIYKYLNNLNGNIYINQDSKNNIIIIRIPISIINFLNKYDFKKLFKNYTLELIEKKYTLNKANIYINELLFSYIETLKNPTSENVEKIKKILKDHKFDLLNNLLDYIIQNNDEKIRNLLISKLKTGG
ncbi:hypothetical protein [Marinitoga sp. 38H-ov]|uniref:hypothetical protein n=1 Tax=Marinitoga sp. 38H-ov TaxID=1755814 RepID=UPI0013EADD58|nr:hypothetical protein [Marinitoga sp. 38H-ov]KAF2956026.1 hypothetical protein AS160_07640 [Marinitoga sp. 38H-ov]